jgi:hypothetical protein
MGNFFSSPYLFDDLHTGAISCCGNVRQNYKGMPADIDNRALKLKWGYLSAKVKGVLTAMIWKDKRDVCILTDVYKPPADGNFFAECRRAHRPAIVEDYSRQQGTEWLIAIQLVGEHGSGQRNYFFTC